MLAPNNLLYLIISTIFFPGMKLNWVVCNFLSSPRSFSAFWHLIQPAWVFKAFKARGSEIVSVCFVNKLGWFETTILHQYSLTCSALFLDLDLPPLWLLLIVLAINMQNGHKILWLYWQYMRQSLNKSSSLPSMSIINTKVESQDNILSLSCSGQINILFVCAK